MKTLIRIIIAAAFISPCANINAADSPFTSNHSLTTLPITGPARILVFNGSFSHDKVLLNWTVDDNENANQFEVERSSDGKTFRTSALVFGTDKAQTDNYAFYEKATGKNKYYRLKIIYKDLRFEYSPVITVKP